MMGLFNWDYFDPAEILRTPLSTRQRMLWCCRERADGEWDYYPRGFGKPGFRVDWAALENSAMTVPNLQSKRFRLLVMGLVVLIVAAHDVLAGLGWTFSQILPLFLAATLIPGAVLGFRMRQTHFGPLRNSAEQVRKLSALERRSRNLAVWGRVSSSVHRVEFLILGLSVVLLGWSAVWAFHNPLPWINACAALPAALSLFCAFSLLRYSELAFASARQKAPAT